MYSRLNANEFLTRYIGLTCRPRTKAGAVTITHTVSTSLLQKKHSISFLYTMVQPSSKVQGGMVPSPKVQGPGDARLVPPVSDIARRRRHRRHRSCACDHNIIITILIRFTSPSPAKCFRDDTHDRRAFENSVDVYRELLAK